MWTKTAEAQMDVQEGELYHDDNQRYEEDEADYQGHYEGQDEDGDSVAQHF